jgi:hypothetical protein
VSSPVASSVHRFLRLTLARVEHLPGQSTPRWNALWSIIVVEGAVMSYFAAAILVVLRVALGQGGFFDSNWGIWLIIAAAMLAAWFLCRGIERDSQTVEVRARVTRTKGVERFKESGLGAAFLIGGLIALSAASYFAMR